jgi:hypothetical protein
MDAERQRLLQSIVALSGMPIGLRQPICRRQYSSANSWREYTSTTAFITASKKTPKKIATRNDGFSGFAGPGTPFRTGQMS